MGPVDFLGCPIEEGDVIAYPVRRKSEMYLKKAKIFKIQTIRTVQGPIYKLIGTNDRGRQVTIEKAERTIVIA